VRRARRSCDVGWIHATCQDYAAVTRNIPISAEWQVATTACVDWPEAQSTKKAD